MPIFNHDRVFPNEEKHRARSRSGKLVLPKSKFVQPDNGALGEQGSHLTPDFPIAGVKMKSWNVTDDLNGGI